MGRFRGRSLGASRVPLPPSSLLPPLPHPQGLSFATSPWAGAGADLLHNRGSNQTQKPNDAYASSTLQDLPHARHKLVFYPPNMEPGSVCDVSVPISQLSAGTGIAFETDELLGAPHNRRYRDFLHSPVPFHTAWTLASLGNHHLIRTFKLTTLVAPNNHASHR